MPGNTTGSHFVTVISMKSSHCFEYLVVIQVFQKGIFFCWQKLIHCRCFCEKVNYHNTTIIYLPTGLVFFEEMPFHKQPKSQKVNAWFVSVLIQLYFQILNLSLRQLREIIWYNAFYSNFIKHSVNPTCWGHTMRGVFIKCHMTVLTSMLPCKVCNQTSIYEATCSVWAMRFSQWW